MIDFIRDAYYTVRNGDKVQVVCLKPLIALVPGTDAVLKLDEKGRHPVLSQLDIVSPWHPPVEVWQIHTGEHNVTEWRTQADAERELKRVGPGYRIVHLKEAT